uniref:ACB domain-containing protein n=1 Tax=Pristionchus pacificus TaxID=54126 RepID=A0A8R1USE5_PRIPA
MPPQGSSEVVPQQEIVADFTDDQLDRAFAAFAKFTQMLPKDGPVQTPVGEQLETYALYKQATIGPCNTPKPSLMHPILRLMWNAWNKLGNMTKREAKRTYVENFIKRTERNYEKHHKDLPAWMADKKYEGVKTFVKERREDFGITYMHTPQGLKEVSIVGKEIGFEL